ncbi:MAG: hypothetical protein ACI9R3_002914, partial [Verrucomicrobiales bacterium]
VTVNEVVVSSGATSATVNLSIGSNTLSVKVTAEDGVATQSYVVSVTRESRPPGSNASLAGLVPGAGTLSPGFVGGTLAYGITVPNTTTSMTLTSTVADPNASITVNEVVVASGATSAAVNLSVGSNTLMVKVTAEDGLVTKTYIVSVTREPVIESEAFEILELTYVAASGEFRITWNSESGVIYAIERSKDLQLWEALGSDQVGSPSTSTVDVEVPDPSREGFYLRARRK